MTFIRTCKCLQLSLLRFVHAKHRVPFFVTLACLKQSLRHIQDVRFLLNRGLMGSARELEHLQSITFELELLRAASMDEKSDADPQLFVGNLEFQIRAEVERTRDVLG